MSFFTLLLLLHIGGAIVGFGPTFSFALLGPMASERPGPGGLALMEAMVAIERKLVIPVAAVIQPLTGILLIFQSGRNEDFFSYEWLWIAILIYIITFYVAVFVQTPRIEKMIEMAKGSEGGTPAFEAVAKPVAPTGAMITLALVVIIILMVVKPGN